MNKINQALQGTLEESTKFAGIKQNRTSVTSEEEKESEVTTLAAPEGDESTETTVITETETRIKPSKAFFKLSLNIFYSQSFHANLQ